MYSKGLKPASTMLASILVCAVCSDVTAEQNAVDKLLSLTLEELMEIEVITSARHPEKVSTLPASVQVITREQIQRSGATGLPDALRLATNLSVAQTNSHEWVISARGFSSDVGNKLLVMIDGRSIYTPLFSGVFWSRQDYFLEDIERIEVISGTGGTMWGANAVNGVINIITRNARTTQGIYIEGASGTGLQASVAARYGGRITATSTYRIYGKYRSYADSYVSDGSPGSDDWYHSQGGFRVDMHPRQSQQVTLQGDIYQTKQSLPFDETTDAKGVNLLGRWSQQISKGSDIQLQVYFDRTELTLPVAETIANDTSLAPPGIFEDRLDTLDLDFQHHNELNSSLSLTWGLGYRHTDNTIQNAPGLAFYPDQLRHELYSAFMQQELALIADTLYLIAGTKIEKNDYTGYEWEPSSTLKWLISPEHMAWVTLSRAVRMPSRIDRDISQPAAEHFVILRGDDQFDSEIVNMLEFGYRGWLTDTLTLSLAVFHNEYDDLRSTSLTEEDIFPLFFANNLMGKTNGFELNLHFQPSERWQLRTGYTFLHQDIKVKAGQFDFNNAYNETADPKHQLRMQLSYDLGSQWAFDTAFRWVDRLPTNNVGELTHVPSYAELDVRVGWKLDARTTLSLVGQNLLNKHHQEFGVPGPQTEEIRRNLYLKVQWRQ